MREWTMAPCGLISVSIIFFSSFGILACAAPTAGCPAGSRVDPGQGVCVPCPVPPGDSADLLARLRYESHVKQFSSECSPTQSPSTQSTSTQSPPTMTSQTVSDDVTTSTTAESPTGSGPLNGGLPWLPVIVGSLVAFAFVAACIVFGISYLCVHSVRASDKAEYIRASSTEAVESGAYFDMLSSDQLHVVSPRPPQPPPLHSDRSRPDTAANMLLYNPEMPVPSANSVDDGTYERV